MEKISIIGLGLAKRSIQVHAAGGAGQVILCRKVSRDKLLQFLASMHSLLDKVRELDLEIARRARRDDVATRLMTIPGIG